MKKFIMDSFPTDTPSSYPTQIHTQLFEAILTLKNKEEAKNFFRDLLTMPELNEFANRWQVVKLLVQGKPYTFIAEKLKVSTATITRVAQWLRNGMGGYQKVADRLVPIKFKDSYTPTNRYTSGKSIGLKKPNVL